jgi:hypothetical protein
VFKVHVQLQQSELTLQPTPADTQLLVGVQDAVGVTVVVGRPGPPITKSGPPHPTSGNASIHSARTITNPLRTIMDLV